jgi:Kef-type K+ transport system membrane component KefB
MPPFSARIGERVSEPQAKLILLILFLLGGLAIMARSEAVLPAYILGMALASFFVKQRALAQKLRVITFTLLTPFFFLMAGSLLRFETILAAFGLVTTFLVLKMVTKFAGILPLTYAFGFGRQKGVYMSLLMCTGLTFGSIAALFGLNHGIIDRDQYSILVAAVIASAVVPTLVAERWFYPHGEPDAE